MPVQPDLIARGLGALPSEVGLGSASARYRVYIRDADYQRVAELTEWISFSCVAWFNDVGTWQLECSSQTIEAELLTKDAGVIVTRELEGVEKTVFSGFVWTEWGYTETTFRAAGYSDEALLWTPARPDPELAGPPFASDYDVRTGVASSVMLALVNHNIGPILAPAPWAIPALRFIDDPLLGSTITARANLQPLITLLAELALTPYAGGLGFYLRQSDVVTNRVEFGVYAPPDRSADAKFSVELGTVAQYEDIASAPEANHVYVMGGDGFGANRTVIAEQDDDSISEWGRVISTVVDMRGTTDTGELNQRAAEAIAGVATMRRTAITPFDVPSLQYGRDYDLGTLVTVVTRSGERTELIRQVEINLDPERGATITPIVGQGDGTDDERTATIVRSIQGRVSNIERNWNVPDESITNAMLTTASVEPDNLHAIDAPSDGEMFVYDSVTGLGEWVDLSTLAAATTFTTLTATGAIQGSRFVSTVTTGTAPLAVTSTTKVTNLNADLIDGLEGAAFALRAGDTFTGLLTLEPSTPTQQSLKLKNGTASGGFFLGATSGATPSLILTDNGNVQVAAFGASGDTNQLVVNGTADITATLKADRAVIGGSAFTSTEDLRVIGDVRADADLYVGDDAIVQGDVTAARGAFGASTFSSSEELRVVGQTRLEGLVEVIGNDIRLEQTQSLRATDGAAWRNLASIDSGDILQYGEDGAVGAVVNAGYVQLKYAGTVRFEVNTTGVGMFGVSPIARPTVVGVRTGTLGQLQTAFANLCSALNSLGAIIDATT